MITVKLTIGDTETEPILSEYFDNSRSNDVFFDTSINCKKADFWFIIDNVNTNDSQCVVSPNRIFWFDSETMFQTGHYFTRGLPNFLKQFARAYTFEEIPTANKIHSPPFLPWMINNKTPSVAASFQGHARNFHYLASTTEAKKPIILSVICSTKTYTPEQKLRLRFLEKLKTDLQHDLVWVGNGKSKISDKYEIISKSKYHLVLENKISYDVFSEKLFDAFLGNSFPIYSGAPNIDEYFDKNSILSINLRDYDKSLNSLKETLSRDLTNIEKDSLQKNKNLVLNEYNLIKRLYKIAINSNYLDNTPTVCQIFPKKYFLDKRMLRHIYSNMGEFLKLKLK